MKVNQPFILESNFIKESANILKNLIKQYNYSCIVIRFTGDMKILHSRFLKREYSKERHPGLISNGSFDDFEKFKIISNKTKNFKINEQEIIIDSTDFSKVDFSEIMKKIYECLKEI